MSPAISRGAIVFGFLLLHAGTAVAGDKWLSRLDEAERLAERDGKDLFILFTGTAWCAPCVQFESNVLSHGEFLDDTGPFILVKLEFPKSDEELPPGQRKAFAAWRERYGIRAFPTVILADAAGRPYAVTGHIGLSPAEYGRYLGKLREAHNRRDTALLNASKAQGVNKGASWMQHSPRWRVLPTKASPRPKETCWSGFIASRSTRLSILTPRTPEGFRRSIVLSWAPMPNEINSRRCMPGLPWQ